MLKAKALCAADGGAAQEIRPLMPEVEKTEMETVHSPGLRDLVGDMQNIVIESIGDGAAIPESVIELAVRMMNSNELIKDLLLELRQNYIRGQKEFYLSLAGKSESEKKQIIALFQEMSGLVSSVRYCAEFQSLNGSLLLTPKAQKFLTGQYLELAVYEFIRDVLEELAEKYHADYEIYRNVRVASCKGQLKNEFDIVICFNKLFYVVECKSGKNFCDWGGFAEIGQRYGIVPDRLLLVDSFVSDSQAERIEFFCDYYVCNLKRDSLREKVSRMIGNDMAV